MPEVAGKAYNTLCFEAPQDQTSSEIIDAHKSGLEFDIEVQRKAEALLKQVGITKKLSDMSFRALADLMHLYVSSQKYLEVAEKIRNLAASRMLKEIFEQIAKLSVSLKGIDLGKEDYHKMMSADYSKRLSEIDRNEDYRNAILFENLLKLRAQQEEGIVFLCGAAHASALLAKFKEQNMQNDVLYYFPHSSGRLEHSIDDIAFMMNDTLRDHTHLLTEESVKQFSKKIVKDITDKTRYKKEIPEGNSHSQFLTRCFKANFRIFMRPGYYVDALVDIEDTPTPHVEKIRKDLGEVGVQTHDFSMNNRQYLVVPNVNVRDVANRIWTIKQ